MLFILEILTNRIMTWFPRMHQDEKGRPAYTDTQQVSMSTSLVHTNHRHQGNCRTAASCLATPPL